MKKTLAIVLSVVMVFSFLPILGVAAEKAYADPAKAYAPYNSDDVASGKYDDLNYDQIASLLLDYVDRKIAVAAAEFNTFEIDVLGNEISITLNIDSLDGILSYAGYLTQLGGDFATLDVSALQGLTRANGDINFIYSVIQFVADNADAFGKVFRWDEGETFDFGKVGEYIESLPVEDEIRVFYEDYLIGNNIQEKFVNEIAGEMNYTIGEGEIFDDVINNGILKVVTDFCAENKLLSEAAIADVLQNYNLRTTDIYTLIKNFAALLQSDNQVKINTYFTFLLDSLVRTALKTAFGYKPEVGGEAANAEAVKAEFNAAYGDLAMLRELSGGEVFFRAADGTYYNVTVSEAGEIAAVKTLTWANELAINFEAPVVGIYTKAEGEADAVINEKNCALIKEYHPTSENYAMHIYSPYKDVLESAGLTIDGTEVPAEFTALMTESNYKAMNEFFAMSVTQNGTVIDSEVISFAEIEAFAEQKALEAAQAYAAGITAENMTAEVKAVDVTLSYNGYATDDEFITSVTGSALADVAVTVYGMTTTQNIDVSSAITNPIATVVVDNISGGEGILDAAALFNTIDTDFAVDVSILDFAANYDEYNGVIGQVNRVLCGLVDMLLTDEGYADLALTTGGNENLTANVQKICTKADSMISAAKEFMDAEGFAEFAASTGINELFASSHGLNANMIYELDFSSVESIYVCAAEMILDFIDDETEGLVHELHLAIEGLTTLDQIAVALTDLALDKAIPAVQTMVADFNTEYGTAFAFNYVNTHADAAAVTDNAKDVIMTKLADLALYTVTFAYDDVLTAVMNKVIDKVNTEAGLSLGQVDFTFGVTAGENWQQTLGAVVDRVISLANGLLVAAGTVEENDTLADKLSTLLNAVIPFGTMFSNCSTTEFDCDVSTLSEIVFTDVLSGNFDSFLALFEAYNETENNKPGDIANGVSVTYALVKASDYIVDSFFPDTVCAELYAEGIDVQQRFTSAESDAAIAARNMISVNNRKYNVVPAVLDIIKESGILPSLANPCEHANTHETPALDATCTAKGYTAGVYCDDCEKYISGHEETAVNASNHVGPFENIAAVAATCISTGYTAGTKCNACGAVATGHVSTEINASNHVHTSNIAEVPATCTQDGTSAGVFCSDCNKYVSGHNVIAAVGHIDSNADAYCDVCGEDLGHEEEEPTFFERIANFFRRIVDWFRSLFS